MLKAIYIGDKNVWEIMRRQIRPAWDWQSPVLTIDDYRNALEDGRIKSPDVIVLSPQFYTYNGRTGEEDFASFVREAGKTSLLTLLDFWTDVRMKIDEDLTTDTDEEAVYRWINPRSPLPDLDKAIREYVMDSRSDPAVVSKLIDFEFEGKRPKGKDGRYGSPLCHDDGLVFSDANGVHSEKLDLGREVSSGTGKIITVTSSKGGSGKTTVAVALGQFLAASSRKASQDGTFGGPLNVCVVDLSLHNPQIGEVIGTWAPTMMKSVLAQEINRRTMVKAVVHDKGTQCDFLLAPKDPAATDLVPTHRFGEILSTLRRMYDVVVVDTSVEYTSELLRRFVYPMSDRIVFVTTLDRPSVAGLERWISLSGLPSEAGGAGVDLAKVSVLINREQKNVKMTECEIEEHIRDGVRKLHEDVGSDVPEGERRAPLVAGAIPELPNGILTRCWNEWRSWIAFKIPPFEKSVWNFVNRIILNDMPHVTDDVMTPVAEARTDTNANTGADDVDAVFWEIVASFTVDGEDEDPAAAGTGTEGTEAVVGTVGDGGSVADDPSDGGSVVDGSDEAGVEVAGLGGSDSVDEDPDGSAGDGGSGLDAEDFDGSDAADHDASDTGAGEIVVEDSTAVVEDGPEDAGMLEDDDPAAVEHDGSVYGDSDSGDGLAAGLGGDPDGDDSSGSDGVGSAASVDDAGR